MSFNTTPKQLSAMFDKIMRINSRSIEDFAVRMIICIINRNYSDAESLLTDPVLRHIDPNEMCQLALHRNYGAILELFRMHGFVADDHESMKRMVYCDQCPLHELLTILEYYPEVQFDYEDVKTIMKFENDRTLLSELINSKSISPIDCLTKAVIDGENLELIRRLCSHCSPDDVTAKTNGNPLAYALSCKKYDILEILFTNCKLDVPLAGLGSKTPLAFAIWREDYRMIMLLLKHGAKTTTRMVIDIVRSGNLTMIEIFAKTDVDFNVGDDENIPIVIAARMNRSDIFQLLIDHGADVSRGDAFTPESVYVGQLDYFNVVDNFPAFKMLVEHGADTTVIIQDCIELGISVIIDNSIDFFECILDNGYPVEGVKKSLLIEVVSNGNIQFTKKLLERGADVNQADANGMTALHAVFMYADDNVVPIAKLLLDHGADRFRVDILGDTPYDKAIGDKVFEDILKNYGIPPKIPSSPPMPSKKSPVPAPLCGVSVAASAPLVEQLQKELDSLKTTINELMVQFERVEDLIQRLKN